MSIKKLSPSLLIGAFLFARMLTVITLPIEGLRGYGDFTHFFQLASLPGWPFFNYWVEFPPIFPFISAILYRLAAGQEHVYDYLLVILLSLADAGSLYFFYRIAIRIQDEISGFRRVFIYLLMLSVFAYGWWYYDPIAVVTLLCGVWLILERKDILAGTAVGMGLLVKLFPVLALVGLWKTRSWQKILLIIAISCSIGIIVYGILWINSPKFTVASLQSQWSKGSWETIWALLDGNYRTGNFGPEIERLNAGMATVSRGNAAVIPGWIPFVLFGAIGIACLVRINPKTDLQTISMIGLAWSLFLLASPGWSPQWILYLIPLILLIFPERLAYILGAVIILINLLEWPVLLSRGMFWGLNLTIPIRTIIFILMAVEFFQSAVGKTLEKGI
ncbi:MAG: glycosyltransferase 87 family protein [Anaerolineaceae bacterium]|nr:glycosyltransferase 87 family protein [Anaerolineaceae bacterium]